MTLLSPARMVQLWLWLFQLGVVIGGKLQIPAGITREEFFKQNPDLSPTKLGELDPSAAASASFAHGSYEAYRNAQIDATAKKTGGEGGRYHAAAGGSGTGEGTRLVSFAHRESVEYLAKELTQLGAIPTDGTGFGLCHAVRFGHEVQWFQEALGNEGVKVLGTDISPMIAEKAKQRGVEVIEWDFHKVKPAWIGKASFVYTNALDHSYDPVMAIQKWLSCLTCGGILILEWTREGHSRGGATSVDVFEGTFLEYVSLATKAGGIIRGRLSDKRIQQRNRKRNRRIVESAEVEGYATNNFAKRFLLVGRNCTNDKKT